METEIKKIEEKIEEETGKEVEVKFLCPGIENKFMLVRVGDRDRPASEKEITEVQIELEKLFKDNGVNCLTFVTHHAISIEVV